jgi:hypothetical protein
MTWPGLLIAAVPLCAQAEPWEFDEPIAVTASNGGKTFHHLESAGRHNIAVSADTVAVAWEDDRDGTPRIYLARKPLNAKAFSAEVNISGNGEAFEPSLLALENNRFALAWEEDARIHVRLVTPDELGPVVILGESDAMQPSLATRDHQLLLVYSRRDGRFGRIWIQGIEMDGLTLQPTPGCAVDAKPAKDEQLYPTVVSLANQTDHTIVAWEDRRPGHTIIMAAESRDKNSCHFHSPQRINKRLSKRSNASGTGDGAARDKKLKDQRIAFGKGFGAARVALAQYGAGQVLAVWADKRNFREGYDIYAADYQPGNTSLFGPNVKVQDSFGGVAQQWHATVAGDPSGRLVVAWDDKRDGDANIMLSWLEADSWSDDVAVPGADGAGEQNHPTITLDREGNLHLAWVERTTVNGPTQLRYLFGQAIRNGAAEK